jgi:ABC-type thiamine transport system substrate-binding protein
VEEGALHGKLRRFVDVKKGLAFLSPADVKVRHVDLVPGRQFLEDVVVSRRDRVMDVVLGGDEQDFHEYLKIWLFGPERPDHIADICQFFVRHRALMNASLVSG